MVFHEMSLFPLGSGELCVNHTHNCLNYLF